MKANFFNFQFFLGILFLLSGCSGDVMSNEVNQYEWYVVATAPRDYPMEVVEGTFFYKDQSYGVSIPAGGTLNQGWGVSTSVYLTGPKLKPLPEKVSITFYSYAENQFYESEFLLPYEKIHTLFQQQIKNEPDKPYDSFLIGIAPGGTISVWIKGPRTTEVYHHSQAKKVEMSPSHGFKLPFDSKEQSDKYIENALAESVTPEQLVLIKSKGAPLGLWNRFRSLYKWSPAYKDGKNPIKKEMAADFLNGESYWIPTQFSKEFADVPRPLPSHLQFRASASKDDQLLYIIDFDPIELLDTFEKLGAHGENVFIEFDAQTPRQNMKIRVYNDKESISLKRVKIKA